MTHRIRIAKGLDIPISGAPEQSVHPGPAIRHVALCGLDFVGLKPRLLVAKGESVSCGQALFIDKRDPDVPYVSPGCGRVTAINRGARRVLESVVISLEETEGREARFDAFTLKQLGRLDRSQVVERLQESGLWTAFRTRPFSRVPPSVSVPRSLFVTALDTRPLAADPQVVIRDAAEEFHAGLWVLAQVPSGKVYLCTAPGWNFEDPDIGGLERVEFSGPHPAGLPGTHIHHIDPVGSGRTAWHIGYQDVIAIGRLFLTGEPATRRVIALAGDQIERPRLLSTRLGASTEELTAGDIRNPESCRVISGSVLGGRTAGAGLAYLGRYHDQVSVIREGGDRQLFGWMGYFPKRYSAAATFLRTTAHKRKYPFTTSQNGRFSGMLPMRVFERLLPMDILPSPLFRAMMVQDTEQAQALGCLELDEEDLALCSFACPAKSDFGAALRLNLTQIEKEG